MTRTPRYQYNSLLRLLFCFSIALGRPAFAMAQSEPTLRFATYLGGGTSTHGEAAALDADGHVYVAGHTTSADFPTLNALHAFRGGTIIGTDGFVAKLSPEGMLRFATFFGGSADETITALAIDDKGRLYLAGSNLLDRPPHPIPQRQLPGRAGARHRWLFGPVQF